MVSAFLPPREVDESREDKEVEESGEKEPVYPFAWWTRDLASEFPWAGRPISAVLTILLPIFAGIALLGLFTFAIYPRLPQEFGGVKPRCAQLDIATGEVSRGTLVALAPKQAAILSGGESPPAVVRTEPISIYYSRADSLLVKRRGADDESAKTRGEKDDRTYELNKDAVRAMITC